jgi:hypothetical protein
MNAEPCGPPQAHFSEWTNDDAAEPIEIVDTLDDLVGPIEIVPAPALVLHAFEPEAPVAQAEPAAVEAGPESAPLQTVEPEVPVEAVLEVVAVEVVPLALEAPLSIEIEASPEPEPAEVLASAEPADDDPYALFVRTLAEVAVASGATMDAATIDALLESDAVATAWRAILRGESEDFSKCAATLDEWAANALASILSAPQKAGQLRRELRARGVAAFGLIDAT